jgi:mono/diheme cytochrome c family protein
LKKKRYITLAAVLVVAALVGLAGWGYARPALASAKGAHSERKSSDARNAAHDGLHRLKAEDDFFHFEGRDKESGEESDDRGDSEAATGEVTTTTTGGPTTTTTSGATTTTTVGATTTTTARATTTTTQATTTTTQATTTTTQPPATTTTTAAINAASLFSTYCRSCHGSTPISSTLTAAQILTKITTGSMSGYASSLTSAQRTALAGYVAGGGR